LAAWRLLRKSRQEELSDPADAEYCKVENQSSQ
jgi:hypothetical protein